MVLSRMSLNNPGSDVTQSNKAQMAAAAYRLPAMDMDFLLGDTTRGLRFQLEYQKAEEHLRKWGVATTVIAFGSARIPENDANGWYAAAREFARICSEEGAPSSPTAPRART